MKFSNMYMLEKIKIDIPVDQTLVYKFIQKIFIIS